MREKIENKVMQNRKLEDAIRMHHGFIPDSYKSVKGKIINNFRKHNTNKNFTHMWNNWGADMPAMFPGPQDTCEVNGILSTLLTSPKSKITVRTYWKQFQTLWHCYSVSQIKM